MSDASGDVNAIPVDEPNKEDVVAYSTHKKLLSERKRDQEKMRSLQEQLDAFQSQQKEIEQKKLEEKGEYGKAVENYKSELAKERENNTLLANELQNTWKKQAFYSKLGRPLVNDKYEVVVKDYLESISIDPETQRVDTETVDMAVNNFLEEHEHILKPVQGKKLPGNAPGNYTPKPVSAMDSTEKETALRGALTNLLSTPR